MADVERGRGALTRMTDTVLRPGERVVALLPYTHVPKRPKGPEGKVRTGIYQSYRRYRPLVLTDHRLLVFETGRTPHPRSLLAAFPAGDVSLSGVEPGRFGTTRFLLHLPGDATVPFVAGRKDRGGLDVLTGGLGRQAPG